MSIHADKEIINQGKNQQQCEGKYLLKQWNSKPKHQACKVKKSRKPDNDWIFQAKFQ